MGSFVSRVLLRLGGSSSATAFAEDRLLCWTAARAIWISCVCNLDESNLVPAAVCIREPTLDDEEVVGETTEKGKAQLWTVQTFYDWSVCDLYLPRQLVICYSCNMQWPPPFCPFVFDNLYVSKYIRWHKSHYPSHKWVCILWCKHRSILLYSPLEFDIHLGAWQRFASCERTPDIGGYIGWNT